MFLGPLRFAIGVADVYPMMLLALRVALALTAGWTQGSQVAHLEGITFATVPGRVFVPLREAVRALGLKLAYDEADRTVTVEGIEVADFGPSLFDGTRTVPIRIAKSWGFDLEIDEASGIVNLLKSVAETDAEGAIQLSAKSVLVITVPPKQILVDKQSQQLSALQGGREVLRTNISTGGPGHTTPNGQYAAGAKYRMHYSKLYNNSPMPWSIQVSGNIFIHGYRSVPSRPASHGCVRVPIRGKNPAKWLFEWVEQGTPITISGHWAGRRASASKRQRTWLSSD